MLLWIILMAMCSVATVAVTIPLVRRYESRPEEQGLAIFREQIAEIERDHSAGTISKEEAELARVEVQRRMLSAAKAEVLPVGVPAIWRTIALAASLACVVLGAGLLYSWKGSPEAVATGAGPVMADATSTGAGRQAPSMQGSVGSAVTALRERLVREPEDAEGWRMLGWSYFSLQRFAEAADAYGKAAALKPDELQYQSAQAEALVQDAGGIVTPHARATFERILRVDPKEERSRYYLALAHEQSGNLQEAYEAWSQLLRDAPEDASWLADVRSHMDDIAKRTGRSLAASPPATQTADGDAATQDVIAGMIAGLQAKLDANPRDRDGWAMMIRSRNVAEGPQAARAALDQALQAFQGDAASQQQLRQFAQALGIVVE